MTIADPIILIHRVSSTTLEDSERYTASIDEILASSLGWLEHRTLKQYVFSGESKTVLGWITGNKSVVKLSRQSTSLDQIFDELARLYPDAVLGLVEMGQPENLVSLPIEALEFAYQGIFFSWHSQVPSSKLFFAAGPLRVFSRVAEGSHDRIQSNWSEKLDPPFMRVLKFRLQESAFSRRLLAQASRWKRSSAKNIAARIIRLGSRELIDEIRSEPFGWNHSIAVSFMARNMVARFGLVISSQELPIVMALRSDFQENGKP